MFSRSRALLAQLLILMPLAGCSDEATRRACDPPLDPGCLAPVVDTAGLGRFASATAWSDERLAAASWDTARGALVVAFFDRPDASPELRVVADGEGGPTRIAAEASGHVQLVWFDRGQGRAFWARGDRAGFGPPELIGQGPGVLGTHLALALDTSARQAEGADPTPVPHVALRDETRRSLSYAFRQADGWHLETVDTCAGEADCPSPDEDVGEWAQLALVPGAGGTWHPRIAFYDRLRGDLKLAARGEDGRWLTSTLDGRDPATGADTGDVGRFISLATTPGRTLGLAYFDATREALRYLGPGEAPRIVDAGLSSGTPAVGDAAPPRTPGLRLRVNVGQHASLRYDAVGQGHIVYADTTTPALRHLTVRTANTSGPSILPLPPGAWPTLTRVDERPDGGVRLHGVYGAFGATPARSSLEVFTHDLAPTGPAGATP